MKIGRVSNKFVRSQLRLDGKFHLSEGLVVRKQIYNSPYEVKSIYDVTSNIYCPGIFRRNYVSSGVTFLGGSDIKRNDLDSGKYLTETNTPNFEILKIKKGWTLVTCGGTIGETVFANKLLAKCWISQHVMRVIPNVDKIKEGMLFSYLATKYGKSLLTTNTYGTVIPTLNASNIGNLPIPVFPADFQEKVDTLIQDSARLREEATEELEKAKRMIEEFVGISKFNLSYQTQILSSKNIQSRFKRLDSQYQIGKFHMAKEKHNLETIKIRDIAYKILVGNRGKREYVDKNGIPFLSSSDMMMSNPLRQAKQIRKNSLNIGNLLVSKNDILISRSGTVGNTIIVGDNLNGVAVSEHAMKLGVNPDLMPPEYVFAYFQTKQGQNSLKILPYGSVIITLGEEFLGDVDLPIIPKELMDKVVPLVREYITNNDIANQKETEAISLVEAEIEKWNS